MPADSRTFAGRDLSVPAFTADTGAAPPGLVAALEGGRGAELVSALLSTRVLVAVVAVADGADGGHTAQPGSTPAQEAGTKEADLAVVTVRAPSGRLALPVFSSVEALAAWSGQARPVPVAGVLAARAAYDEGATALLVDPAGPVRRVVEGPELLALAENRRSDRPLEDPQLLAAVGRAGETVGLTHEQLVVGRPDPEPAGEPGAEVVVRVLVGEAFDDAQARETGRAFGEALAADPAMQGRLAHGVDVRVERGG